MSASREKRERQKALQQGQSHHLTKEQKEARKEKRKWRWIALVFIVVIVLFIALAVWKSNFIQRHMTAVTIGDEKFVAMDVDYFYESAYSQVASQYGGYFEYIVDTSIPLSQQAYDDTRSWRDYLVDEGVELMQQSLILSDAAKEAGYTLSDEGQAQKDELLQQIDELCKANGLSHKEYYAFYGAGMTEKGFIRNMDMFALANDYRVHLWNSYEFTDADYDAYYAENSKEFDSVDYAYYLVVADTSWQTEYVVTEDMTEEEKTSVEAASAAAAEAAAAACQEQAEDMAAHIIAGGDFDAIVANYLGEPDAGAVKITGYTYSTAVYAPSVDVADWVFDDARTPGEVGVVPTSNGCCIVVFGDRYLAQTPTVDVRHILITPAAVTEDDPDGSLAAAADEAAAAEAQRIYDEWLAGDATEESFAALATEYSADGGSVADGGLYEGVFKGQMVPQFDEWCFDESRQPGDTGIVKTDYGYHIMYFVDKGDLYWKQQCDTALRNQAYEEWYTAQLENYPIGEYGPGMKLVGK